MGTVANGTITGSAQTTWLAFIPLQNAVTNRILTALPTLLMAVIGSMYSAGSSLLAQENRAPLTREASAKLLVQTAESRDANQQDLRTAFGSGKIRYTLHEADALESLNILDADIQVFYDKPKFRVHLLYEAKLEEALGKEKAEKWIPSRVTERVIIYDGSQIYSVEYLDDGSCTGTIYFGFAKMAVMRKAGFPFEDPVHLWSQALKVEGLDLKNLTLVPLAQGGFVGELQKNTYRMKFIFLDEFGYDLRRVSSYRTAESQPFRDYSLRWAFSGGVHHIKRFTNTVTSANRDTGSSAHTSRKLTVDFEQFEANIPVDSTVFELRSIAIPEGAQFFDKRSNVEGGPKVLVFRNQQLEE